MIDLIVIYCNSVPEIHFMELLRKCHFIMLSISEMVKSNTPVRMAAPKSTIFSTLEEPISLHA